MGYRRYRKPKRELEGMVEGLLWLIGWKWQIGAILSGIGFALFWYTLIGAFNQPAEPTGNLIVDSFNTEIPVLLFMWPAFWFIGAVSFAWISVISWAKCQELGKPWH
ncbi:MAG: hypothetical protein H6686_11170 [Fibrobacteria bacterium]|nr:hypothetical protein [Fibrobacteria bacterium]